MRHHWPAALTLAVLLLVASCQTLPPPDPVTMDEILTLGAEWPENPALVTALETRPLGFPLTYEGLKELERRGASPALIDTVVALTVDRRARAMAPRYATYYDPWFYGGYHYSPWHRGYGPRWGFGMGYRWHGH